MLENDCFRFFPLCEPICCLVCVSPSVYVGAVSADGVCLLLLLLWRSRGGQLATDSVHHTSELCFSENGKTHRTRTSSLSSLMHQYPNRSRLYASVKSGRTSLLFPAAELNTEGFPAIAAEQHPCRLSPNILLFAFVGQPPQSL